MKVECEFLAGDDMQIRIECDALEDELYKLQGIVSERSTLEILSNTLLEAEGETLTLHATDLDTSISTSCSCEVETPGSVTLPAKNLFNVVKNLESDSLTLEVEENHWAQVDSGSVSCRVVGTHPDDFPEVLDASEAEMFPIAAENLLDAIDKTLFSISTDDARANLTGAFFKVTDDDNFLMVSTDGHRLSKIETEPEKFDPTADTPQALRDGIIIPKKGLSELQRIVEPGGPDLEFGIVDNDVVFRHGPTTLSVRLVEGTFPDFTQIIPDRSGARAIVDKAQAEEALKFAKLFSDSRSDNVRLTLEDDELEFYASDPEHGEGKRSIPADFEGESTKAGYNYRYLQDAFQAVDGDEASIEVLDQVSPTTIRDPSRENLLFIVMPMRM